MEKELLEKVILGWYYCNEVGSCKDCPYDATNKCYNDDLMPIARELREHKEGGGNGKLP